MSRKDYYPPVIDTVTFTLTTAATGQSDAVDLRTVIVTKLRVDSTAMTGTVFTFLLSEDGSTYLSLYDNAGVEYQVTGGAIRYVNVPGADLVGNAYIKIRSGTAAAPTAETTGRTVTGIVRPI